MARRSPKTNGRQSDDLHWALPPVRAWFAETFGEPTPAQRGGWPSISGGMHTLISAPTGTGKTLAAFLACLDAAWRTEEGPGTLILYVSPLKALNRDIAANLEAPLAGIARTAERLGMPLRPLSVGVRTGDTSAADRRAQAKRPPDVLITTPESLHLLLTSKFREGLRGVSHVILDEIHDLCSSKRGASLSLMLERLEELCPSGFVRIGLSATANPLDLVARFLGGWCRDEPRPVAIVDAGVSKRIEVRVESAIAGGSDSAGRGKSLESRLLEVIRSNRSTLIFANNRVEVERLTIRLNRPTGSGSKGADGRERVRSHHGSLSLDRRRETEEALKRGDLAAVVATSSLELGIDVGSIDRVCQLGSPGSVARGLQRVGRAGHSAGAVSRASFFARNEWELIELAALAGAMREGAVEPVRIPRNCLDVLAQQVVALVSAGPRDAAELFSLVRRADCFRSLPVEQFEAVVAMLSGRSDLVDVRDLRPRIRWDRIANRLEPLPGTFRHALMGGNTIPDSGQFPVYLEGGPRLGEFDEDFVMERRVGDAVLLGTSTWVIRSIDSRRVTVVPAEGRSAVIPFWRGEGMGRSATLGRRVGLLRRTVVERIDDPGLPTWLHEECSVERPAADAMIASVARQLRAVGAVPDDRTVLVESFLDESGVRNLTLLTPSGRRFHLALRLVLQGMIRARLGIAVHCQHGDDGVLIQFPGGVEPPLDLLARLAPDDCEGFLLVELGQSALFGLRFRQVAGRALLSGGAAAGGRTPLWFLRLRADELLTSLRSTPDHPLIVETVRECLRDDLDLDGLLAFVRSVQDGSIEVRVIRPADSPSPLAAMLARSSADRFADRFERRARNRSRLGPERGSRPEKTRSDRPVPGLSLAMIDPDAVQRVEARLRGHARPPRSAEEMAELLRFCGDLKSDEVTTGMASLLDDLSARGVAVRIRLDGVAEPDRWISTEALPLYRDAFTIEGEDGPIPTGGAIDHVVRTLLRSRALVGIGELASRYGIDERRAREILGRFASSGEVVPVAEPSERTPSRWGDRRNIEDARRISVALRRTEAVAVEPDVFIDLLARHQHVHPGARTVGRDGLEAVLRRFRGFATVSELWESELLPRRIADYSPPRLDELLRTDGWRWRRVEVDQEPARVAIVPKDLGAGWVFPSETPALSREAELVRAVISGAGSIETEELATLAGLEASAIGPALLELTARGLIGGDHFDPIRTTSVDPKVRSAAARSMRASGKASTNRRRGNRPLWGTSGVRWSSFPVGAVGEAEEEGSAMAWALALLDRYGVLCRETAALDPWAPAWSVLRDVLDAAELRGEVRRGYFVAGLSGVQFSTGPFADQLARHRPMDGEPAAVLLSSLDPANLYGSGGPFDLTTLDGQGIRLVRSPLNHIVLVRGRPVLVSEGFSRKLTTLPWAEVRDLAAAVATLPTLAGPSRRILKVKTIDGRPALDSRIAARLIEVGFVRDPPGLAYYAGW